MRQHVKYHCIYEYPQYSSLVSSMKEQPNFWLRMFSPIHVNLDLTSISHGIELQITSNLFEMMIITELN